MCNYLKYRIRFMYQFLQVLIHLIQSLVNWMIHIFVHALYILAGLTFFSFKGFTQCIKPLLGFRRFSELITAVLYYFFKKIFDVKWQT